MEFDMSNRSLIWLDNRLNIAVKQSQQKFGQVNVCRFQAPDVMFQEDKTTPGCSHGCDPRVSP